MCKLMIIRLHDKLPSASGIQKSYLQFFLEEVTSELILGEQMSWGWGAVPAEGTACTRTHVGPSEHSWNTTEVS